MKKGFTLLELLIVIAIIALLSILGGISVSAQRKKANDVRRRADIHQLQVALEGYYADHQKYPDQLIFNGQPLTSVDGQTMSLGGDVIIKYDELVVKSSDDVVTFLARYGGVGQNVILTVLRDGQVTAVTVTPGVRPRS